MCGIFGMALGTGPQTAKDKRELELIFYTLACLNQARGVNSSGVYCQSGNRSYLSKDTSVAKKFFTGQNMKNCRKFFRRKSIVMGHTRKASVGGAQEVRNAHPFRVGSLIGMHNGGFLNHKEYVDSFSGLRSSTDSEVFFRMTANCFAGGTLDTGRYRSLWGKVEGSFALSFVNTQSPRILHLSKLHESLAVAYDYEWDTVFYSSKREDLEAILTHRGARILELAYGVHRIYDVHDLMSFKEIDLMGDINQGVAGAWCRSYEYETLP